MPVTFPSVSPSLSFFEIPEFSTHIISYGNKIEQRIQGNSAERWRFKLWWRVLSEQDKQTLQQFFLARKGAFEAFTFNHPNPSQVIGTNSQNYTCIKTHTADSTNRPITGASYTTYWTQSGNRGITWVSGDKYKYEFLVRFKEDASNFEYFVYKLWRLNEIELIEVNA